MVADEKNDDEMVVRLREAMRQTLLTLQMLMAGIEGAGYGPAIERAKGCLQKAWDALPR